MNIKTIGDGEIHLGNGSTFICNSVDIGNVVTKAIINIGVDEVVMAVCDIALTGVEIDGAVLKINKIKAPDELIDALRDFFKNEIVNS